MLTDLALHAHVRPGVTIQQLAGGAPFGPSVHQERHSRTLRLGDSLSFVAEPGNGRAWPRATGLRKAQAENTEKTEKTESNGQEKAKIHCGAPGAASFSLRWANSRSMNSFAPSLPVIRTQSAPAGCGASATL